MAGGAPIGWRNPDRSSEKFAYSIAEVTDPLALKVPPSSGFCKAKPRKRHFVAVHDRGNATVVLKFPYLIVSNVQTQVQKLTIIRTVGVLTSRTGRSLGEVQKKHKTCKKH